MKDEQTILNQRARKNATRRSEQTDTGDRILVVTFRLKPETYCIWSAFVTEVLPFREITPIPGVPPFVLGVMNVRGKIISVINLKTFFSLKETGITESNKIIIVKQNLMEFGIIIDEITGTYELIMSKLSAPPVTINGIGAEYVKGVTPEGLILLDIEAVINSKSLIINNK